MKLTEIKDILGCKVLYGEDMLDVEIAGAFGSDLMSDVLAFIGSGALLLTGLTTPQSARTADMADAKAILYVRGKKPDAETIAVAKEKGIPLLITDLIMYEACGRLFSSGLPPCRTDVGRKPDR